MMDDDLEADDAAYAALEAEIAEGDETLWDGGSAISRDDDDGGDDSGRGGEPLEARERGGDTGGDDDTDAIERASLEADELEFRAQEQARYNQQYQRQPDVFEDPLYHLQSMGQELQAMRSQREYQAFVGEVSKHEDDFKVLQPDYAEGVAMLEKSRRSELAQMFPDRSPQAHLVARRQGFQNPKQLREAIFTQDAQTVARNALAAGINPAKAYFDLAKERGYKPKPGRSAPSRGGRSGGRSSGGSFHAGMNVSNMASLYSEDPEEFDRQWDKAARSGALG